MINAPVGFRFNPAEEELACYYLVNRVAGNSQYLWQGLINEFDVYAEEPWELWGRFYSPNLGGNNLVEAKSDQCIYFFTYLKKVASGGNGKRVKRRVGTSGGTWHEQNSKKCKGGNRLSWFERRFSYKNDKCKEQDGVWLMMELCFNEDDNLVLCRIGKKPLRGGDDGEAHSHFDSFNTRGRSTGSGFQASSPVVYDVNDDNFTVPGTKRMRTEGIISDSDTGIVDGEQVQTQGGVGCRFRNHGPDFGASNQGIDAPFHTNWMQIQMGMEPNISSTLSGPVLIESELLEPTSIEVPGGLYEQTSGIGNIGGSNQEDHTEVFDLENNENEYLNHEEVEDGSTKATMDPNTMMHEEVGAADMGTYRLDDLKGLNGDLPDQLLGPDATWNSLPNLDDVDVGVDEDPMTFSLADLGDLLKY